MRKVIAFFSFTEIVKAYFDRLHYMADEWSNNSSEEHS